MYVTFVQNISASMQSVSSLCDSLKHLTLYQIDPFLSENLLITCHSTLYEKWTLFIRIHLYKIDTGPIFYPIGTHRRQTPITMLSHIPRKQTQAPCLVTCTYTSHIMKNSFNIHTKFLSCILNKDKINPTIKMTTCDVGSAVATVIGSSTEAFTSDCKWLFRSLSSRSRSSTQLCSFASAVTALR